MEPRFVEPTATLIDELLAEQKSLSAVARFARIHEQDALPAQARYYRDLIPLTAPGPGQQYAFEVDLDQCSGCKACVTACHALNGLDDDETWRSVGLLHGLKNGEAFQRTVTTACHHCADPACAEGCPTLAYEKDSITGIVRHLDDQCIGCQYCALKCPYDVPQYSKKRGIVRKCDMCSNRLAVGEAPACVQACPNEAIQISLIDRAEASREIKFLPDSPAPDYTRPTTRYRSSEPIDEMGLRAADHAEIKPAHAHPPLVWFLVLTQMAVGGFALTPFSSNPRALSVISLISALAGLGASVLHLGRPQNAWRSFLGWRRSWLSREILAFGIFAPLAIAYTLSIWLPGSTLWRLQQLLSATVSLAGISGVVCSVMVYHDTRRKFWRWPAATIKFFGSSFVLGAATAALFDPKFALPLALFAGAKFAWNLSESFNSPNAQINRTAALLRGPLKKLYVTQLVTLVLGGLILSFIAPPLALAFCLAAELIERHLFFVAVSPDKMPGMPT